MAQLNKAELASENNNSFPNNNAGLITPSALRTFNGDMIDSTVNQGTYNTDSASFSGSIAQLQAFSSSLDATFATDAQLTALSTSVAVTNASQDSQIAALQNFSSSLDATYVTDSAFNTYTASQTAESASFNQRINALDPSGSAASIVALEQTTASLNTYTASNDVKWNNLGNQTGSFATTSSLTSLSSSIAATDLAQSSSIAALQQFSSSLDTSFVSEAEFGAYTSSNDAKVTSIINKTGSFATTGSNTFNGNQNIVGALTASGLNYPTADNGAKSFVQTDGAGNLSLQYVDAVFETVRNSSGVTLSKGTPVYISGSTGDNGNAYLADASDASKMPAMFILGEDLDNGDTGIALVSGLIEGVNTSAYAAGTEIYVAEGGGWTSSRPTGSASIVQKLGVVTKQGVGGQGVVINQLEAELPNLQTGYVWVGNGTNQPVAISTGSFITESETGSFATTGSNTFIGDQKITGSVRVDGDLILDDDGGTTSFLLNQKFSTEFLGSNLRWQEAAKKVTWEVFEKEVQLAFSGYSSSYDNGLIIDLKSDGTTFSDYNPSFVNQSWLRVLPNNGSNPAPQMTRGLGITGSFAVLGNSTLSGSLAVSQSATFNGQTVFNGISVFNVPLTASGARINGDIVATGNITATSASFQYVETVYETASIIYSSGSNQLGDELSDVQTLSGSVKVQGSLLVNGVHVQTSSFDASGYLLTSSFNSYTQSNDSVVNALVAATSSYVTETESGSFVTDVSAGLGANILNIFKGDGSVNTLTIDNATSASYADLALTASFALNAQSVNTGSFATTGSNIFIGNQFITGALLQSSSLPNEFTRVQIARSNKAFFGEANTLLSLVGDSQGIFDFYADGGNYDTLNVVVNQNGGTTFRDWTGAAYNNWLVIPTNTGANPAPQFKRGLGITGSMALSGSSTITDGEMSFYNNVPNANAIRVYSGSVEITSPQGTGRFYSNLPMTSSGLRINGTALVGDLIVSGVFAGDSSLQVLGNASVTGSTSFGSNFSVDTHIISGAVGIEGSLTANGKNIINEINNLNTFSSSINSKTGSYATTGSNDFKAAQTITGSLRVDGDLFLDDDGGTTQFLMNAKYFTEFKGAAFRWQEANKTASIDMGEENIALLYYAYGSGYDNGYHIDISSGGTTFSDYNTSYVKQPWLKILPNPNTNPAPQFQRGLGITGSLVQSGSVNITGSVNGNVTALSISSNTASMNLNNGNFFTLQLVSGSNTRIEPSNIKPGQSISLLLSTTGSGTVTFPSSVKQQSGSAYVPTTSTSKDILTFVAFDSTDLYLTSIRNLV